MSYQRSSVPVLKALFPTTARRAVVELVFSGTVTEASMSELARRAGLTPRAVAVEVQRLEQAGLVDVQAVGPAHVVRPNLRNPATSALSDLVEAAKSSTTEDREDRKVRRSLAAFGAPLAGEEPKPAFSLPETLLRGLKAARGDATILRVLPVVVAKHASELDWKDLTERARRMNLRSELGMLLDLTAKVADLPNLRAHADQLSDARRKRPRYFPVVEGAFERQLAARRSPESATRWHFLMNMTEDSFRETVRKHVPAEQVSAPAEVEKFFQALDRELRRPVTVTVIGGAAIGLRYDPRHTTTDIDLTPVSNAEFWAAVDRVKSAHPIPIQTVAFFTAPYDYESRRTKLAIGGLKRLTVLVPEIHDLAIMKAARALTHDLEAVEDIHKKRPLNLDTLVARYYEARTQVTGSVEEFTTGFLALVERLYGSKEALRIQHRIEHEPPPPLGDV